MKVGKDYIGISTAFFCHDGQGNFLFHKRGPKCRDERGKWDNGGGQHEFGITMAENVLKELKEELSCDGEINETLPAVDIFREHDGVQTHWLMVGHIVKVNPKDVKSGEPGKIEELSWFTLDNLPEPLHPGAEKAFKNYSEYFDKYR